MIINFRKRINKKPKQAKKIKKIFWKIKTY